MNFPLVELAISMLVPLAAGTSLIVFLERKFLRRPGLLLALGYGTGLGVLGQIMLSFGMIGIPFTRTSLLTAQVTVFLVFTSLAIFKKTPPENTKEFFPALKDDRAPSVRDPGPVFIIKRLCAVYIVYNVFFVLWNGWNVPLRYWDSIATMGFAGKVFFYEHGLYHPEALPHPGYPLQMPFCLTWTALNLGYWDEQWTKLFFPFFYLAFLVIFYHFIKIFSSRGWALIGLTLVVSSNLLTFHGITAYRDLPMLYFNCTAVLLLILWHRFRNDAFLLLGGLFSGFTTFTKLEGAGYLLIHAFLLFCMLLSRNPRRILGVPVKIFKFLIPSGGIFLLFIVFKASNGLLLKPPGVALRNDHFGFHAPLILLKTFLQNLLFTGNWNAVWTLFFLSLFYQRAYRQDTAARLLLFAVLSYLGLYFFAAWLTPLYAEFTGRHKDDPLSRLILHFFPLAVSAVVLVYRHKIIRDRPSFLRK